MFAAGCLFSAVELQPSDQPKYLEYPTEGPGQPCLVTMTDVCSARHRAYRVYPTCGYVLPVAKQLYVAKQSQVFPLPTTPINSCMRETNATVGRSLRPLRFFRNCSISTGK